MQATERISVNLRFPPPSFETTGAVSYLAQAAEMSNFVLSGDLSATLQLSSRDDKLEDDKRQ